MSNRHEIHVLSIGQKVPAQLFLSSTCARCCKQIWKVGKVGKVGKSGFAHFSLLLNELGGGGVGSYVCE
jgi:hypothetical protein